MDASVIESEGVGRAETSEAEQGPSCHVCGYSRRGLPARGLCPECGEPPSPPVSFSVSDATAVLTFAKTQADRAWLWCVALGLVLLVVSSFSAARVALLMRAEGASVAAVNIPAPKVWVASLVQRSVGNRPGEWGVAGTLAVLGCLVGVWLVTEPRALRPAGESPVSVRRLARWSAVLLSGGVLGVLLGGFSISYYSSRNMDRALLGSVALAELPANTMLYMYLRQLARRLGDRRAGALFDLCALLVPAAIAGGAALLVLNVTWGEHVSRRPWQLMTAVYGAAAVAGGVVATVAVVRLAATTLLAAAGGGAASLAGSATRLPRLVRQWVQRLEAADLWRWLLVLGLAWSMWNLWAAAESSLFADSRDRVGGTVPSFNFPGPKVMVLSLVRTYPPTPTLALESLLIVWLLTCGRGGVGRAERVLRRAARWGAVVLVGLAVGWRLSDPQFERPYLQLHHHAVLIVLIEAPLTLLVYLHLALVARREGAAKVGRALAILAALAPVLMATPPVVTYLLRGLPRRQFDSDAAHLLAGAYTAVALAVGLVAASALARLLAVLVARPEKNRPGG